MKRKYSLMIHGGAGAIQDLKVYRPSIKKVLTVGQRLLEKGATSLDVVEACVVMLENDPVFNAGKGSVLNERGVVEMDASIMDGSAWRTGAVAGVSGVKNPIHLARLVMDKSQHVMLIGTGAVKFGKVHGVDLAPDKYFIVPKRVKQWREAKLKDKVVLDHSALKVEKKMGTVGAVAMDVHGNLAAATSTGGMVNKKFGRVGDTPIIGSGTYADNATCAVSATGFGEQFIRTVLAKHVAEIIRYKKVSASIAAKEAIDYFVQSVNGHGGIIVVDRIGRMAAAHSTPTMLYGRVGNGITPQLGF